MENRSAAQRIVKLAYKRHELGKCGEATGKCGEATGECGEATGEGEESPDATLRFPARDGEPVAFDSKRVDSARSATSTRAKYIIDQALHRYSLEKLAS